MPSFADDTNRVSFLELDVYMRNVLLRDTDVMSMAHGLEVRVPFLDHEVVEVVAAMPGGAKLQRGLAKPLLAGAMRDLLPSDVAGRDKRGFELPFAVWLRGTLHDHVRDCLLDPTFGGPVSDVLDHSVMPDVWSRFEGGKGHWTRPWALYALKAWSDEHLSCTG